MKLNLDVDVLRSHIQKYSKSCVPMGIELVLKLMGKAEKEYYELQDEKGDVFRGGREYDKKIIKGTMINLKFDIPRGPGFPLTDLFKAIYDELNAGRYVNCAWKPEGVANYHAYVIYGYEGDELLAVTKFHNDRNVHYINDMKKKLTDIQGSDILTFTVV